MKTVLTRGIWTGLLCLVPSVASILIYAVVAWRTPPVHLDVSNAAGATTNFDAQAGRGLPVVMETLPWVCVIVALILARGADFWSYFTKVGIWIFGLFGGSLLILAIAWILNSILARP